MYVYRSLPDIAIAMRDKNVIGSYHDSSVHDSHAGTYVLSELEALQALKSFLGPSFLYQGEPGIQHKIST